MTPPGVISEPVLQRPQARPGMRREVCNVERAERGEVLVALAEPQPAVSRFGQHRPGKSHLRPPAHGSRYGQRFCP